MAKNSKIEAKDDKAKEEIDLENIKNELKDYVDIRIKNEFESEVTNINKKIVSEKNRRLFFKNVIIFILLIIIGFLVFLLYKEDYFDRDKSNVKNNLNNNTEVNINDTNTNEENITLKQLISNYSYLLDNIFINENSEYINDYYSGNLSNELKNYLALNNVNFSELTLEDNYNIFNNSLLKTAYKKLFNDELENISFNYNSNKIRYINALESYVSDNILKKTDTNINREIINVIVKDENISITTVEGIIKEKKLYNCLTLKEISNYNNDNLSNYKDELNIVTYTFNGEKLINVK